jgi:hypothetical protein
LFIKGIPIIIKGLTIKFRIRIIHAAVPTPMFQVVLNFYIMPGYIFI